MPSSDFAVSRHEYPIHEIPAGGTVFTGIRYRVHIQGVVPWFEEHDAMVAANHTQQSWDDLGYRQQAEAVAHYRLKRMISLHENEAVDSHAKRRAAKGRKKR